MLKSLNQLGRLRSMVLARRSRRLARRGVTLGPRSTASLTSRFVTRGGRVEVGADTLIAFKTLILAQKGQDVRIGTHCFIGGGSTILPGVSIGDSCIIGAGSVVMHDVPAGSIAAGNPARVLRQGLKLLSMGRLPEAAIPFSEREADVRRQFAEKRL